VDRPQTALRRAVAPGLATTLVLGLAGCSLVATRDQAAAPEGEAVAVDAVETGTADGAGGSDVAESGSDRVVGFVSADASDRHPGGSLLTVRGVEVRERSVAVDVSFVNGRTEPVQLAGSNVWLLDDQGNAYEFDEPEQNADLEVGPGAELTGSLVFLGVLDPRATSLTLRTNVWQPEDTVDLSNRNRQERSPQMQVSDLPLP
jgi:hypothetical protein